MSKFLQNLKIYFIMLLSATVILMYQNCSQPLQTSDSLSSLVDKDKFPFEAKIDTLAYLSCSDMTAGTVLTSGQRFTFVDSGYFTFKLGGYGNNAGVRLSDGYVQKVQYLDEDDMEKFMSQDPDVFSFLQLIVRDRYDLSLFSNDYSDEHWLSGSAFLKGLKKGLSGDKFFIGDLGAEGVRSELASSLVGNNRENKWHSSFLFSSGDERAVEASLFMGDFPSSTGVGSMSMDGIKTALSSADYETHLTVNFSSAEEARTAKTFNGANKYQAFGKSYRMEFSGRKLSRVLERDLSTGTREELVGQYSSNGWNCDEKLKLRVYPYKATVGDRNYVASDVPFLLEEPSESYLNQYLSAQDAKKVSSLLLGDWYVNLDSSKRVAVKKPKSTTFDVDGNLCYSASKLEEYKNATDFPWDNEVDTQYLTICLRN